MRSPLLICCALSVAALSPALAGYPEETGYTQLKAELGAALPNGSSVGMTQVEAPLGIGIYVPQAGTGTYAGTGFWTGKSFTARSGAGTFSFHASDVAANMYGDNTNFPASRSSMCPGVVNVDNYNAVVWDDEFLSPLPGQLDPAVETRAVQNHAWIYEANPAVPAEAPFVNDLLRRQDFSINRDNYVCCVGINNGAASAIPDLFATGYNVISVGLTNGLHSRGLTTAGMDGPGRRKPEIVAPNNATSFSTGYVSSAAGLLRHKANLIGTPAARSNKTIKALLLAGATKDEFPSWSRTAVHPIDAIYGAGELNILNSYYILDGGEQAPDDATARPPFAWDAHSLAAGRTADYRLSIPAGMVGVELSAFLVWHRTLTDSNNAPSVFTLTPDTLINFNLTLFRDPVAGPPALTIDSSTSTLYNIEHVWQRNLPAGNYRLRVSRGTGDTHEYSLAWRLTTAPHQPQPEVTTIDGQFNFTFPGLLTGQPYKWQTSSDLITWTDLESFTGGPIAVTRVTAVPAGGRALYRLLPVLQ